jgi:hypothetical protein
MSELIISKKEDITNIADAVRSQTGENNPLSLTDIADEIKTLSTGGLTGNISVQADWQQNDETALDYVKNRTHYIEQVSIELLPEFDVGGDTYIDLYDVELFSKLSPNAKCVVTINGVSYEATAKHDIYNAYEWYVIGNSELIGEGGDSDTHLPFGFFIDKYDENWGQCEDDVFTLKIDAVGEAVHKIPEIYLPAKIGVEGIGSFAEVFNNLDENIASGDYSHAENFKTTASGYASHAEGLSTKATGYGAHSEGCGSEAEGVYSHASGYYTKSEGAHSTAIGEGTIASGSAQTTIGRFNVADKTSLFIVGNGSASTNRNNAFQLSSEGNGIFSGYTECDYVVIRSSTAGSNKTFKLTIDDSGNISVVENT